MPTTKRKKREVKAWIVPPLKERLSRDGWNFYLPIFLTRKEALEHASKELVRSCTITY